MTPTELYALNPQLSILNFCRLYQILCSRRQRGGEGSDLHFTHLSFHLGPRHSGIFSQSQASVMSKVKIRPQSSPPWRTNSLRPDGVIGQVTIMPLCGNLRPTISSASKAAYDAWLLRPNRYFFCRLLRSIAMTFASVLPIFSPACVTGSRQIVSPGAPVNAEGK